MKNAQILDLFSEDQDACCATLKAEPTKTQQQIWKEDLSAKLDNFCEVAKAYNTALDNAQEYLDHHSSKLSLYSTFGDILKGWLNGVCKKANTEVDNITSARINLDFLSRSIRGFDFPRSHSMYDADIEMSPGTTFFEAPDKDLADWAINNFDFDSLQAQIDKSKKEIVNIGLTKSAEYLLRVFYLKGSSAHEEALPIKQQKGRYVLEISNYGRRALDRADTLQCIKSHARTFELESDACGLSYCLQMLINEEHAQNCNSDMSVPSRTKVAEDGNVSGTFFKEKIKLAFEPEVFEALFSFMSEYKKDNSGLKKIELV